MNTMQKIKCSVIVVFCSVLDIILHIITSNISGGSKLNHYSFLAKTIGDSTTAAVWVLGAFSIAACIFIKYKYKLAVDSMKILLYGSIIGVFWLMGNIESVSVTGSALLYEITSGISDSFPIFLMIFLIGMSLNKQDNIENAKININFRISPIIVFSLIFVSGRYILYLPRIIYSGHYTRPLETFIWTLIMGISIGVSYVLFGELTKTSNKLLSAVKFGIIFFGGSWGIFQLFIPMMFEGTLADSIIRIIADIVFVILSYYISEILENREQKISIG